MVTQVLIIKKPFILRGIRQIDVRLKAILYPLLASFRKKNIAINIIIVIGAFRIIQQYKVIERFADNIVRRFQFAVLRVNLYILSCHSLKKNPGCFVRATGKVHSTRRIE